MKLLVTIIVAVAAASASADVIYPIVDTGQIRSYDDKTEIVFPKEGQSYFGQDAQYLGNAPKYRDNGDNTISDLVTGLMWQKSPGAKKSLADAMKTAKACRTGGHQDWRVPTIKELYSLILFSGTDPDPRSSDTSGQTPFIDTEYFDFSYGNPKKYPYGRGPQGDVLRIYNYVLCVRGGDAEPVTKGPEIEMKYRERSGGSGRRNDGPSRGRGR